MSVAQNFRKFRAWITASLIAWAAWTLAIWVAEQYVPEQLTVGLATDGIARTILIARVIEGGARSVGGRFTLLARDLR